MKILIIEDEISLLKSMNDFFFRDGFICDTASNYDDGKEKITLFDYDCIILDVNLPGGSGLKLVDYIRDLKKQDGIIIISARNSVDDKIKGLELGSDDYITKPFHISELSARVKSLIRRKVSNGINELYIHGLKLCLLSKKIEYQGEIITFTRHEFNLLCFLINNQGRVISRQAIAEHLIGEESLYLDSFDFVYSHIKNIKKKLKDTTDKDWIKAVYGLGYKMEL